MEESGFGIMVSEGESGMRRNQATDSRRGKKMRRRMLVVWLCGSLAAAAFGQPVATVEGISPTQAVLSYMAPDNSACTVRVSESDTLSPPVHDVNGELFSGAAQDLTRATTATNAQYRKVTIGARTSEKASNGWMYSRALQAFTQHYYSVECSSGTATGAFTTANIPLGNTFPEPPPFNADGFGNYAWPTIDWADPSKAYIDPMTGVLIRLAYAPPGRQSNSDWGALVEFAFASYVDLNGAWSDAANVLNKSTSGPFASYSGSQSDPLFVSFNPIRDGWSPGFGEVLDDVRLTLYGTASGSNSDDRTMLACLSIDSGQSCVSGEIELPLSSGSGTASGPGVYPLLQFSGWGGARYLRRNETSTQRGTVNVSGTTVTLANVGASYNFFDTEWKEGSKIYIQDSAPTCPNSLCAIASVDNARQLTIQESPGTLSGKTYRSAAWGMRLRKKTGTGAVSINSSYTTSYSTTPAVPLGGVADFCSKLTTTVSYAADGVTPINPAQGRLCILQGPSGGESLLVLLMEDTGEVRTLSDFFYNGGWQIVPFGSSSTTDALSVYVHGYDDKGGYPKHALYRVQYNAEQGKFRHWPGDKYRYSSRPADYLTWTNLTPSTSGRTIEEQVAAAITTNPFYKPAMGANAGFVGIVGNHAVYSLGFGGSQDSPCFVIRFDLTTGTVAQIADTMGGFSPTGRWGGCHTVQAFGAQDWLMVGASLLNGQNSGSYMNGPFEVRGVSQVHKSGDWSTNTAIGPSDFYTCTVGNPYEAQGATGNNCLKIRVTGEPCSAYPTASEKADYPCPWDANRSMPQTLQPGDYLWVINPDRFFNGKNEKVMVVSKTGIGDGAFELEVMRMATCRGVLYFDDDSMRTHANGWAAVMCGTGLCGGNGWWLSATGSTWYPEEGSLTNAHGTFGSGLSPDRYTMLVAGTASRFSQPVPEQFGRAAMYAQQQTRSSFAGVSQQSGVDVQSYPNKGQWTAPVSEQVWALDLRHYNPSTGSGSENGAGIWNQSYALVAGTTKIYKINNPGVYGKTLPYLSWAGRFLLKDMSGPTAVITDADEWRYCVAWRAGECREGSSVNDTFVNVPRASLSTSCIVNQYAENYPCFNNGYSFGAWATQHDVSRDDPAGVNSRRLTMAFTGPGRQYQFKNLHATPSGRWAFFESGWIDGVRDDMLLVKLPPWPNTQPDGTRNGFVPIQVDLPPNEQYSKARIRFGYAENGPASSFFCTSRREACVTDSALTPFAYEQTETLTPKSCQGGCSISIPAIPGRVLYYRVERLNDNPADIFAEPMGVRVVP